jgi:hypothetical protein
MRIVDKGRLEAGMKLAKAITNDSGMVMISEGSALTDSMIKRIENMEVGAVYIEGEAPNAKSKAELLEDLDRRFRKTEDEKYMSLIKDVIRTRIEEVRK